MQHNVPSTPHSLGQYFTTDPDLQSAVCGFVRNAPAVILEPSAGRGDLVISLRAHFAGSGLAPEFDMYEIDETLEILPGIERADITFGDFMVGEIEKKYATIVGNPPYVRTKTGNLYIDITEKCFRALAPGGELIFIVPSDFFKLTCASRLLSEMMVSGAFTDIYHSHKENLFAGAAIDVLVYRYCKDPELEKKAVYNGVSMYVVESRGMITFGATAPGDSVALREVFDVLVGIVSGKEKVFKNAEMGNIDVRNAKGCEGVERYILIDAFPTEKEELNAYLLGHKQALMERGIRKFNDSNWYEWGALRNAAMVESHKGEACIYMYNLTRKLKIAFVGAVEPFGGGLLMLRPKAAMSAVNLGVVVEYFNSSVFRGYFTYSGRFKIGQKILSDARVPRNIFTV
jgi:adenine-specific DNA-methyltransferase